MPGMPHAWCCEASAMKLFLLFGLVSLTTAVDAEVSPTSVAEQKEDATAITTTKPHFFSTLMTTVEVTTTTEVTTAVETSTTAMISTSHMESTSPAGVTSAELPPIDQKRRTDDENTDYNDELFKYDYESLRKWGLVAAAILFILGILILTCGKHGKVPRCRGKKRARTYDVSQA
ncbi:FXYD domain-containing ion transport regulator 5-like isoform X2 [Sceloporus undulatus]|uniref:FXYD domain-containing ion transport regulator 5-like isoform X2 n=1 Tax=Sceloporus undulatus TaxID=8520 RepID=UPI001C4BBA03|nr:FXYD domain-containing ion transport regulator 5-like isoform X2 [Sceloporus undulatus]